MQSTDVAQMMRVCEFLGAKIELSGSTCIVEGISSVPNHEIKIDSKNSGQILRFIPALCLVRGIECHVTGDESILQRRVVEPLLSGLTQLGAECSCVDGNNRPPFVCKGKIKPGTCEIDGLDSQPVSALLMAAVFMKGVTKIHVKNPLETPWVDLTLDWVRRMGAKVVNKDYTYFEVSGVGTVQSFHYTVPTDFSSMAFLLSAGILTQSNIGIDNLDFQDPQGDKVIIDIFKFWGGMIDIHNKSIDTQESTLYVPMNIDCSTCIDALPILVVSATKAYRSTILYNFNSARTKESDRVSSITTELKKMGAKIYVQGDSIKVDPSELVGCEVYSHNDHRVAMSLAVAGFVAEGETLIRDTICSEKAIPISYVA